MRCKCIKLVQPDIAQVASLNRAWLHTQHKMTRLSECWPIRVLWLEQLSHGQACQSRPAAASALLPQWWCSCPSLFCSRQQDGIFQLAYFHTWPSSPQHAWTCAQTHWTLDSPGWCRASWIEWKLFQCSFLDCYVAVVGHQEILLLLLHSCPTDHVHFSHKNPSSAEGVKCLFCLFSKSVVKLVTVSLVKFPFIEVTVASKLMGMPRYIPAFKSCQLLSRGVNFSLSHVVQHKSVGRREQASFEHCSTWVC